jgi:hypothetical protein
MPYLNRHGAGDAPHTAAGSACAVDDWTRLRRFLVLGSEGGRYYASEWTPTRENATAVERCIRTDGRRAVAEIVRVSDEGRAPKSDPALFGLAMAAGLGDATRGARRSMRCRRSPARARNCSSSRCSSRGSAAGGARCVARWAAGTQTSRSTRSPTRRSSTAGAAASSTATSCASRTPDSACPPATCPSP